MKKKEIIIFNKTLLNYFIYIEGEEVDEDEFELVNKLFQLVNDVVWEWIGLIVRGDFKTLSYCWW